MSLNFTNLLNYNELKNYPYSVKIKDNCTITNYKGDKSNTTNPFTITQKDNKVSVEGLSRQAFKDIHSTLDVFSKIAAMDGNAEELSAEDLKYARQDYDNNRNLWKTLGVTSFRYDPKGNVANLTITGKTLRIDFDDEIRTKTNTQKNSQDNTHVAKKSQSTPLTNVSKNKTVADKYAGIPQKWIPEIKDIAKKWGYSEDIIITKILAEGYTPVAKYKKEGGKKGLYEVGFGHTTNANHNNKFKAGYRTNLREALNWLCQDIKDKEAEIKKFGSYYDYANIPQPLKEMMIDVAFNRGEKRLDPTSKGFDENYKSVIANIKNGYWGSAAVRLRQENFSDKIKRQGKEPGLRKRNVQRFLKLMEYLTPEKIVGAMDLFNREYYYTKTINMLNKNEADSLRLQWNNIYYNAKAKCAKQSPNS